MLFPALEAVGVSREGGPIGVMLNEHQQGREHVARMKQTFTQYSNGDTDAILTLKKHADAYGDLLNRHIDKENTILFPVALQHLSKDKLAEL
ncbi:hypothetical protein JCM12294_38300 [Desulfocicer niacini]